VKVNSNQEIYIAIIAGTLIFLLFSIFTIAYVVIYWKRKVRHIREVEKMKLIFTQELLKSQLEIKEQTLKDISEEIHDNVGQSLSLAIVLVNTIDQKGAFDREILIDVKECVGQAITDLRDISQSLSSKRVQQMRIHELIGTELRRLKKTGVKETSLELVGPERDLEARDKLILFRIVQESLQNIVKHANATRVIISLIFSDSLLSIAIRDNGNGFNVENTSGNGKGLGLQNIVSRANLIKGNATIESTIMKGTCITINIPYEH
jgi:two-component system, NarL family, sensor kinase